MKVVVLSSIFKQLHRLIDRYDEIEVYLAPLIRRRSIAHNDTAGFKWACFKEGELLVVVMVGEEMAAVAEDPALPLFGVLDQRVTAF